MSSEKFVSIYSRSFQSAVKGDLIYTYATMRYLYDPIPLSGDIATFDASSNWVQRNLDIFRSATNGGALKSEWNGYLGRHMATLSAVDDLAGSSTKLNIDKPVAFMPGSEVWIADLEAATRGKILHVRTGEGKIVDLDYFSGELEPVSTTATIEIMHQFLSSDDLVARIKGDDSEFQLGLILQAKDIMYRVLMQSYLTVLRSRAHTGEW